MTLLDRLADAHIEAAAERGEFDNLAGAGKPLAPDEARHVPAELRAGYRLLKNAGFVPPEIQAQRDIHAIEDLLAAAEPRSSDAERLTRRLRWLETRMQSSRRGQALIRHSRYGDSVRRRLAGDTATEDR